MTWACRYPVIALLVMAVAAATFYLYTVNRRADSAPAQPDQAPPPQRVGHTPAYWRPSDPTGAIRTELPGRYQRYTVHTLGGPYRDTSYQTNEMTAEQCKQLCAKTGRRGRHVPHNPHTHLGRCVCV